MALAECASSMHILELSRLAGSCLELSRRSQRAFRSIDDHSHPEDRRESEGACAERSNRHYLHAGRQFLLMPVLRMPFGLDPSP